MKKLILFFAVAAVASVVGCSTVDYSCITYFKIDNQTGVDITVEIEKIDILYATTIEKEEIKTVYDTSGRCGEGGISHNPFNPDDLIFTTYIESVKINGELMPDAIRESKYWNFESTGRRHNIITYTLTLTNELLEEIRRQE